MAPKKKLAPPPMDSDEEEQSVVGAARPRDAEEDVFDVAHNSLLRTATELPLTGRRQAVATADWNVSGSSSPGSRAVESEFSLTIVESSEDKASVQAAVEATWAKANAIQDQAISGATRAALAEARSMFEVEKAEAVKRREEQLRLEAEKATERLWKVAAHEREQAVKAALADQAAELERINAELANQRQKAADELEDAYKSLKAEVSRVLEDQHAANVNCAVQAAWERAGRIQETAVMKARSEARAEAEAEADERMKLERLQLGTEMRRTIQTGIESNADELLAAKAEASELRKQLEVARAQGRDAEANAAKSTQQAVKDAMKAMESVQKSAIDRAVARALAAAKVSEGKSGTNVDVS